MRDRATGVDDSDYPGTEMRKIDISHLTLALLHQWAILVPLYAVMCLKLDRRIPYEKPHEIGTIQ